jgi:hypothetical protein
MRATVKKEDHTEYPYLGIFQKTGEIVLFSKESSGTTIVPGVGSDNIIGQHSNSYYEERFEAFVGKVVLEN